MADSRRCQEGGGKQHRVLSKLCRAAVFYTVVVHLYVCVWGGGQAHAVDWMTEDETIN